MNKTVSDMSFNTSQYYLVSDVGGTNTTVALIQRQENKFNIIEKIVYETQSITDFMIPFRQAFNALRERHPHARPTACCICAAGPIKGNSCHLTNASWGIDGDKIANEFQIKTSIINDFTALSYGIPVLDINNEEEIIKMKDASGQTPSPQGLNKAIVGAGTGLGVGFITQQGDKTIAFASEGGHFDFPAFDDETTELMVWLRERLGTHPDMECFVSGIGLSYIYNFQAERNPQNHTELTKTILSSEKEKQPALIARNATTDPLCKISHQLFRQIYGKMAGNIATVLLPQAGLYIAGGVISKDLKLFLQDSIFIDAFSINYKSNISALLKNIPIYIVRNYDTSLLGAANAAYNFEK